MVEYLIIIRNVEPSPNWEEDIKNIKRFVMENATKRGIMYEGDEYAFWCIGLTPQEFVRVRTALAKTSLHSPYVVDTFLATPDIH